MDSPDSTRGTITDPDARLVLASTSPQRRAILTQLRIPHAVVAPDYREHPGRDPLEHAAGKARSVAGGALPVLGVDTVVICAGEQIGKPRDRAEAQATLQTLSGTTHTVVSGLCLRTGEWEELHRVTTLVSFRPLGVRELERYLLEGEWEGRAGAYAIQGLAAGFVERIDGDYLNVVGLPGALLVSLLVQRFPAALGFDHFARQDG